MVAYSIPTQSIQDRASTAAFSNHLSRGQVLDPLWVLIFSNGSHTGSSTFPAGVVKYRQNHTLKRPHQLFGHSLFTMSSNRKMYKAENSPNSSAKIDLIANVLKLVLSHCSVILSGYICQVETEQSLLKGEISNQMKNSGFDHYII